MQSKFYFAYYSQVPSAFKSKMKDKRVPSSFNKAWKIPKWTDAIDPQYDALVKRNMWAYVKLTSGMRPIPYVLYFHVKDTVGPVVSEICKARCCLRENFLVAYKDFDLEMLYVSVVKLETIRIFLEK